MAADQIELRTTTFTKGHGWLDSYGTLLRDNDILLGRGRWTTGETVLAQVDCQPGAWQIQPGDRILRHWRLDGTGTADDAARLLLSTPIRGTWHSDDNSGATPPLDNRVVKGDSCQVDTGSGDSYVLHYDGSRFRGYGVLAEYRTAATGGAGAKQHSDRVSWRSSSWDGSAAKYREWRARSFVVTDASGADAWDWRLSRFAEGGTERDVLQLSRNGELRLQGNADAAGIVLSSSLDGTGTVTGQFGYITSTSTDPDQGACVFVHGQATKRAIWRFKNPTDGYLGFDAETVTLRPYEQATLDSQLVNSPSWTLRGSYWNGASFTESGFYQQLVMTATTPAGYLRTGSNFDVGLLDLHSTGDLVLQVSTPANDDVSSPQKIVDSTNLVLRGHSWDGAASVDRDMRIRCFVASSADEGDVWAMLYDNGTTDAGGVLMDGTRMVGDAAANVLSFTLDAGTHPAVQSGTTKTTPGGVDAWLALDVNGTTYYVPAYTSKTA